MVNIFGVGRCERGKNKQEHRQVPQESENVAGRTCQADEGVKMHSFRMGSGTGKPACQQVEVTGKKFELHNFGFNLTKKGKIFGSKKWWQKWKKSEGLNVKRFSKLWG